MRFSSVFGASAVFGAVLLLCLPAVSQAANSKTSKVIVIPVVPVDGDARPTQARQMSEALAEELGRQPGVTVDLLAPADSAGPKPKILPLLNQGREHVLRLRLPQAIKALTDGLELAFQHPELIRDMGPVVEGHLLLAEAYFRRGKESLGRHALEQLLRLNPQYELDPKAYPPVFTNSFNATRSRLLRKTRGVVEVVSGAPGADVWLNGRRMGKTPLRVDEVISGPNLVVVRKGRDSWGRAVNVRRGKTTSIAAALGGDDPNVVRVTRALAANRFDGQLRAAGYRVAKKNRADYVVVAAIGKVGTNLRVEGYVGHGRTGQWTELTGVDIDVDMLSAPIEALAMAKEIADNTRRFGKPERNDVVAVIDDKSVNDRAPVAVASATFVEDRLPLAAIPAEEPAVASRSREIDRDEDGDILPSAALRVLAAGEPEKPKPRTSRRPIAPVKAPVQKPVEPVAKKPEPKPEPRRPAVAHRAPEPTKPRRQPLTSRSKPVESVTKPLEIVLPGSKSKPEPAQERAEKPKNEPIQVEGLTQPEAEDENEDLYAALGIEIVDEPAPAPKRGPRRSRKPDPAPEEIRAVPEPELAYATEDAFDPYADPGRLSLEVDDTPITRKWWFWTIVGVGAAAVGTTTYMLLQNRGSDSVRLVAEWQQ